VERFKDLKNRELSIAEENSGTSITAKRLYFKLFHEPIKNYHYQPFSEALKNLKDKNIDAIILTGGQPLSKLNQNMEGIKLLPYQGEPLEGYPIGHILKSNYPWLKEERVRTLSVNSFIVTNASENPKHLYFLKKFIEKLEAYKLRIRKGEEIEGVHQKWESFSRQRCLPPLYQGLEYHNIVKWNPRCKNNKNENNLR
jgi:TRAP-type uncharacterized transport system substrate-binding protein